MRGFACLCGQRGSKVTLHVTLPPPAPPTSPSTHARPALVDAHPYLALTFPSRAALPPLVYVLAGAKANVCASVVYNGVADANQPLTPLGAACINGHEAVVAALLVAGAPPRQSALASTTQCDLPCPAPDPAQFSKWLATYGDLVTAPPSKLAAMGEHTAVVDLLGNHGAEGLVSAAPSPREPPAAQVMLPLPVAIPPSGVQTPGQGGTAPSQDSLGVCVGRGRGVGVWGGPLCLLALPLLVRRPHVRPVPALAPSPRRRHHHCDHYPYRLHSFTPLLPASPPLVL